MVKFWELLARGKPALKWIPERNGRNLVKILGYYASLTYAVLLLCHAVFRGDFTPRSVAGLGVMAAVAAMTAGAAFWCDRKLCFAAYTLGLALGLMYMLYVLIFNAAPGWSDAASLLGFAAFAFLGLVAGVGAEYAKYLARGKGNEP